MNTDQPIFMRSEKSIDTDSFSKKKATDDYNTIPHEATCRICKDEGSFENPLFHPCKCKGSIKYIHESCLKEWVASKSVNINIPGATINCDICHHPMQFKTIYADNMPEKIPILLLLKRSLMLFLQQIKISVLMAFGVLLFIVGLPLSWNFFGKLLTFLLDGELPFEGQLWHSLLIGYVNYEEFPEKITLTNFHDYLFQILKSIKFSALQIVLVMIIHIALYFQYDMIVRENVFSKMVFHKIGPQYSKDELFKKQLKERFPLMDDETIEHAVQLMRLRNDREEQEKIRQGNEAAQAEIDEENRMNNNNDRDNFQRDEQENDDDNDDELDSDYVDDGEEINSDVHSSDTDISDENDEVNEADEVNDIDEFMGYEEPFHERLMNRRAQHRFNNLLDEHLERRNNRVENEDDVFVVERPEEVRQAQGEANLDDESNIPAPHNNHDNNNNNNNNGIVPPVVELPQPQDAPVVIDINEEDNLNAPLLINIKFNIYNILVYFVIGFVTTFAYLGVSYFIPSVVGFILIRLYLAIAHILILGATSLMNVCKVPAFHEYLLTNFSYFNILNEWISIKLLQVYYQYYHGFRTGSMPHSVIVRSIPALTTYLTVICITCALPNIISRGYSTENGMKNSTKRLLFQIFFAIKCTFKVFTLFFIEIVGFPISAGLMLDISLLCPLFGQQDTWVVVPKLIRYWQILLLFVYWCVGTLYMYWFAKYIGMIRHHIIRPGVLFFIRSPDDPNIKILHDSLIHPMSIQLSRLCLSIFIYALFIIVGFGFHERFLFPLVLNSRLISARSDLTDHPMEVALIIIFSLLAKRIVESKIAVKHYVRKYWEKVFEISSSKLRLTSFIIGKDAPTERGYIVYRNIFYKIFMSGKAKWSNPDLFSNPKTLQQAQTLFMENKTIHAYFVPDGSLIRVPSSDIISRNYVQTLFVPVTKNDKLIMPLDLNRIVERNKKNAGEFGYLDEQSTEFDEYTIVYVPPNFTSRYITLIFMLWIFASILLIMSAVTSELALYIILKLAILPFSKLSFMKNSYIIEFLNYHFIWDYSELNLMYVTIGAIILSVLVDKYYLYDLYKTKLQEHIIPIENEEDDVARQNEVNQQLANDIEFNFFDFSETINAVIESFLFKYLAFSCFTLVTAAIEYKSIEFIYKQLIINGFNYLLINQPNLVYSLFGRFMEIKHISDDSIQNNVYLLYAMRTHSAIITGRGIRLFLLVKDRPFRSMMSALFSELKANLGITIHCTIPIILLWLNVSTVEYYLHPENYASFTAVFMFLWHLRLSPNISSEWTVIQHACFIVPILIILFYTIWKTISHSRKWLGTAVQNVKDEIYARGRLLENFDQN
ncbi:hypothetical protein TPHA_0C01420 [Tetrapisispora phaffii CBS 4417]|uniref:RING-type E3 ubiquitin transferase n=1 Tax=Tetrapisispora phaffii (strain ATCC 24235 / CBS 4417 / NBRC 1672 / NRRL Y-8282 / UCD 70-5) TaxID=1071381 RepID=G8BRC2_TETPH|nr:hypothetical protein TPHA_0C01420 [Tetrapisispora phaffii CBS 4417]CCE62298.1 hypothetical protein TPHA_0C01420 [Tetrapisispora phaffii CBS 4417]